MKKNRSSNTEVFFVIKKLSMMEYQLIKITLVDEEIKERLVLKSDIPGIVVGYYLKAVRDQRIGD